MTETNNRLPNRLHPSTDNTIVQYHSQANTEFAKQQGYVAIRIEEWFAKQYPAVAQAICDLCNSAKDRHEGNDKPGKDERR